jgi:hypothetical protein
VQNNEDLAMNLLPQRVAASTHQVGRQWKCKDRTRWWTQHREASLNWLALGLLLAAWNASDNDSAEQAKPRPESLRGYTYVSVRAQRLATMN